MRAVSHRIRTSGALERRPTAEAGAEGNGSEVFGGDTGDGMLPARWVKEEVKEPKVFKSSLSKNRFVASYMERCIALVLPCS